MTSAFAQLRALAALRWQMIRSGGVRIALVLSAFLVGWLLLLMVSSAGLLTPPALTAALELAPAAYLGFAVLALIAPLTAGGGVEMVPSAQLVCFPVRPATHFLGGLLLAPVNLVWVIQLLTLAAESTYLTLGGGRAAGGLTTAAYVICVTVFGQALAWLVVGLRQTRRGRAVVAGCGAALLLCVVLVIRLGHAADALRASPTRLVVSAVKDGGGARWAATTATLVVVTLAGLLVGGRACGWALRRPADAGAASTDRRVRRRSARRSAYGQLVATDRASVWRASALRRGGLVLAFLPGIMAVGAAISWESVVVLPGLVAAGAGLLFGVNAFSLDGSGAVWLASLPHDPGILARAKLHVLAETVTAAVVIAVVTGSLRSPGAPTASQIAAIAASGVACGMLVVATCMGLSVRRPHRADLRGPRDAVAPPGALAAASARLALPAGLVGLVLAGASHSDNWWLPPLVAAPVVLTSALWVRRSLTHYADHDARARIVVKVSAG